MDNINKGNVSDVGLTGTTGTGSVSGDWNLDQQWWRENLSNEPYVTADRRFEDYEPGYRFGYESANRYRGRSWNDISQTFAPTGIATRDAAAPRGRTSRIRSGTRGITSPERGS